MVTQSLKLNAAFRLLDQLEGRLSVGQITDELIKVGYIENSEDDYRNYQLVQGRQVIGQYRQNKAKTGDIQNDLVNLVEVLEDGTKSRYYRKCGELTVREAVQHIRHWDRRITKAQEERDRYFEFHRKKHGRKLQRLLALEDDSLQKVG